MPVGYLTYELCPTKSDPDPQNAGDYSYSPGEVSPVMAPFTGMPEVGQHWLRIARAMTAMPLSASPWPRR